MSLVKDFEWVSGTTFAYAVRWEVPPIVYREITAMTKKAPATFTVTGHGAPVTWRGVLTGIAGPKALNAGDPSDIKEEDYRDFTALDANTIEFNGVNAVHLPDYQSGGVLQYNTPKSLAGFGARMAVKRKRGITNLVKCSVGGVSGATKPTGAGTDGAVTWVAATSGDPEKEWVAGATYSPGDVLDLQDLIRLTTANGRIVIDELLFTITLIVSASDVALAVQGWKSGEYELELFSDDVVPVVTKLLVGTVTTTKEATSNG